MPSKTKIHTVYRNEAGDRIPSVTTILGILNKPALLDWAYQCGLRGEDYKAVRDQAADIGTLAHYLIMCYFSGEVPDTSEYSPQDLEKAENSLIKFWDWEKVHKIEPVMVETPLVSEKYRFGGTIDFFGLIDDEFHLLDFKTGKSIYAEHFAQLAAYNELLAENGHLAKGARIVRLGRTEDEGFEERVAGNLDKHWRIFLACKDIYELQKEIRREK